MRETRGARDHSGPATARRAYAPISRAGRTGPRADREAASPQKFMVRQIRPVRALERQGTANPLHTCCTPRRLLSNGVLRVGVACLVGPGNGRTEEPACEGCEPVTLVGLNPLERSLVASPGPLFSW